MRPTDQDILEILKSSREIAIIGISEKEDRDSYRVATYLMENGYSIIPINPKLDEWKGIPAFPSLKAVNRHVDIADVFRRPEHVTAISRSVVDLGIPVMWLQEGVVNEDAKRFAESHGTKVIMNRCIMKEHRRLLSNSGTGSSS